MSVVEGLKIQIHVCGTYVLSVWFTLLIGFGSVWIFSRIRLFILFKKKKRSTDQEHTALVTSVSKGSTSARQKTSVLGSPLG